MYPVEIVQRFERTVAAVYEGGFLEIYRSDLREMPVLHVAGTPLEMGRQCGYLAGDRIKQLHGQMLGLFTGAGLPEALTYAVLAESWRRLSPHVPARYLEELSAVAEGAQAAGIDLTLDDMQRLTAVTNFDLYDRERRIMELLGESGIDMDDIPGMACTMFAVWGSRTEGKKLFALRNLDWVSQTGMHEMRLLTVYRPANGHAFVTMGYAGVIGALAGMNEKGICYSEVGAFSTSEELDGIPWTLLSRQVLEESATLADAAGIVQDAPHTLGYNYLVADGDPARFGTPEYAPGAVVFETNATCCELFRADDPKEHAAEWRAPDGASVRYGLPLPEAVMRGDMDFARSTRALQAADNGPAVPGNDGDPLKGSTYQECHKPMHDMIRAFETGAEYVYPVRGTRVIEAGAPRKIGAAESLAIAATVAHNVEKLHESDWNVMSVVYAPTDLEFWVAFETRNEAGEWANAPDSGYWHFSLRALLDAQP